MIELILVGDVHATPQELPECERLLPLWRQARADRPAATFAFLGDQTDKNDSLSVRVMEFWRRVAEMLAPVVFVVGNHDQVFAGSTESAMSACRDVAKVIDTSRRIGPVLFAAYSRDKDQFLARCDDLGGMLVCHQDLAGAAYDNGRRSLSSLVAPSSFAQVVSGHLHVPQEFGRVWYPGAPRWRGLRDASVFERAIWWVEVAEDGSIARRVPYSVEGVANRVVVVRESEGQEPVVGVDGRYVVEVTGSPEYVQRRRRELAETGARFRGLPVAREAPKVRESDGLISSIRQHLESFRAPRGTPTAEIIRAIKDRVGVEV